MFLVAAIKITLKKNFEMDIKFEEVMIKEETLDKLEPNHENDQKGSKFEENQPCIDTQKKILLDETTTEEQLEQNFESEREKADDNISEIENMYMVNNPHCCTFSCCNVL
ncbi:hypothetical protein Avbf_16428 [Armadillidium vulgare]|nr:hypothetical protein Avbf_16428 [Armadillidium vulgare]